MVFSKIFKNFTNKEEIHSNKKILDKLQKQGKLYKNEKIKKIKKFNSKLIEGNTGFVKGDEILERQNENELVLLKKLQDEYKKKISDWGIGQKVFIDNYKQWMTKANDCQVHCTKKYPANDENVNSKIEACKIGCRLKEPELMDGKNTDGVNCTGINNLCVMRNVIEGKNPNPDQIDGCYPCGGGEGGKTIIRSKGSSRLKNITTCDDIGSAFGSADSLHDILKTACNHGFTQQDVSTGIKLPNGNLYDFKGEYGKLRQGTESLNQTAIRLQNQINNIKKRRKDINSKTDDMINGNERNNIKSNEELLNAYNEIYQKITKERGNKNITGINNTSEAQYEDIMLKEGSQSMQLLIWSGLAILTILLVIQKMRK